MAAVYTGEESSVAGHAIALQWTRDTADFIYETYSRNHSVEFGSSGKICCSSAPEFYGDPECLDPEQAFLTALSSCHMLTFLAIACKKGFEVDKYVDHAEGTIGKNPSGRLAVIKVELNPAITFQGNAIPSEEEFRSLHDRAHRGCIIANSVANSVEVIISPIMEKKE